MATAIVNVTSSGQVVRYSDDKATTFAQFLESLADDTGVWGQGPDAVNKRPNKILAGTGGIASAGPISGTFVNNVTNVAVAQSPYTVVAGDETIVVDTSGGAVTINLPAAVAGNIGRTLYIAKKTSDANAVTVAPSGTNTINGVNASVILGLQLEVANIQVIAAGAWLSIAGDVTINTVSAIDGPAATNRDLDWTTAGSLRWQARTNATAEGGGNAGSDFRLNAYDDTGVLIDAPISIARVAAGPISVPRPFQVQLTSGGSATLITEAAIYSIFAGNAFAASLGVGSQGVFQGIRVDTSVAAPSAVQSGEEIARFAARGFDGTAFGGGAQIRQFADETWAVGAHGSRIDFVVVTNTTTTQITPWRMNNAGHLLCPTDNTFDIGQSGATRPRNIFAAGTGTFGGLLTAASGFTVSAGTITTNLGGGTGIMTAGAADSAGAGFRLLRVPN